MRVSGRLLRQGLENGNVAQTPQDCTLPADTVELPPPCPVMLRPSPLWRGGTIRRIFQGLELRHCSYPTKSQWQGSWERARCVRFFPGHGDLASRACALPEHDFQFLPSKEAQPLVSCLPMEMLDRSAKHDYDGIKQGPRGPSPHSRGGGTRDSSLVQPCPVLWRRV